MPYSFYYRISNHGNMPDSGCSTIPLWKGPLPTAVPVHSLRAEISRAFPSIEKAETPHIPGCCGEHALRGSCSYVVVA